MSHDVKFFKLNDGSQSLADVQVIIAQLDAIITELLNTALRAVAQGDIAEYDIETGQTIQRVKHTNQESIFKSIAGYKKLRQLYANNCVPRKFRLMDSKNFNGRR